MMASKLAVLALLSLLGSVSCKPGNGNGNGYGYGYGGDSPSPPSPTVYPPTSPSPPPPAVYPPTSPSPPPPATYPPTSPRPPPPAVYPPTSPSPPPPATYPPTSPSPPPSATYPPTSPSPPPPALYPPTSPSPPSPPVPSYGGDAGKQLKVGYYNNKCGSYVDVEAVVKKHVKAANAGIQAGLVRLFFHDCFVRGCDASVLLEPTQANPQPEKLGIPNNPSLRGFEVIDAAKAELESACPGIVSCADIVAFAGRDASFFLSNGRANFEMPGGRYDGNVSLADETLRNLPPPFFNVQQLKAIFAAKGLDTVDMVVLSGAHSIGRSHCSSFSSRIPPSNTSDMDPVFAAKLSAACASPTGADNTVVQDFKTPNELDKQYYRNVLQHKVLFESDAALLQADDTKALVKLLAKRTFESKFGDAMVKMGRIEVKTAANGEIRKTCGFVNAKPY
ncbi:hypothetical protein QOZ80_7AG0579020 [Eleusine coracana subsp. coracana]|nr:hypothetical protein QOZ80_7AG0579020 [Eleusine coracana subsp. coracana]